MLGTGNDRVPDVDVQADLGAGDGQTGGEHDADTLVEITIADHPRGQGLREELDPVVQAVLAVRVAGRTPPLSTKAVDHPDAASRANHRSRA